MRLRFAGFAAALALLGHAACTDQVSPTFPPPLPPEGEDGGVTDGGGTDGDVPVVTGPFILEGTVIGPTGPYEGQVLVGSDGKIGCAAPGDACAQRAPGSTVIPTDGVIAPGLIDTHNHILFDIFDGTDWTPLQKYDDHDDWPKETRYGVMLDIKQCLEDASQGKPAWCPAKYDGAGNLRCEMNKWGELKGVIAGTTSIVGLVGTALPCYGSLARTVDTAYNGGLGGDRVRTSAIFPPSKSSADSNCRAFAENTADAFLVHCGEGIDGAARAEFATLGSVSTTPECLYAPQTAITHGTDFTAAEFAIMGQKGMKLIWSPASNLFLYGKTTDIPAALAANITVALAPDWSMGGSQNMLDELRAAKNVSDLNWNKLLTPQMLVDMVTKNAAKVLGLDKRIGTIAEGFEADIMVVGGDRRAPYDAIIAATPRNVKLTIVGGRVLFGDYALRGLGPQAPGCEVYDACGVQKFLCVAEAKTEDKFGQTYAEIKATLEAAMVDMDAVRPPGGNNFAPLVPLVKCQ